MKIKDTMHSTTRILKTRLIQACQDLLADIHLEICEERNKLVVSYLNKFWRLSNDWDEAVECLTKRGEYRQIANKLKYNRKYVAAELLILAHASDTDYVDVCVEDVKGMGKWLINTQKNTTHKLIMIVVL